MRQQVFVKLPMVQLKDHFNEIVSAGYSVSLFTDWQSDSINEVWIKDKVNPEIEYRGMAEFYGAKAANKRSSSYHWTFCRKLHATDGKARTLV